MWLYKLQATATSRGPVATFRGPVCVPKPIAVLSLSTTVLAAIALWRNYFYLFETGLSQPFALKDL